MTCKRAVKDMKNKVCDGMTNHEADALLEAVKIIVEDNEREQAILKIERIQSKLKGATRPDKAE